MTRERPMAAVKTLIQKEGKFLALKTQITENKHIWTLPGGRVEYGEDPLEALHREVREEVSLDVELGDCVGMYYFFIGGDGDQVVLTVFESSIVNGDLDIASNPADENIVEFRWLKPEELAEKSNNESLKKLIQDNYL